MARAIIIIQMLLVLVLIAPGASAIGISGASFADVEQGKTYTQTVALINSPNDFDNHFVIEIDGAIKGWIKASPAEFDLAKGEIKQIILTLEVPKDSQLGEITGTITAVGKKTAPSSGVDGGANVGYAVATKGSIYANVIKSGAVALVEITGVEVSSAIPAGSVAKLTVTAKNSGNVATSSSFKILIKRDNNVVANISSSPIDFAIEEEKTVKLYWDTESMAKGKYEAFIEATTIAKSSEKTSSTAYKPISLIVGDEKSRGISNVFVAAGLMVLILVATKVLNRKK